MPRKTAYYTASLRAWKAEFAAPLALWKNERQGCPHLVEQRAAQAKCRWISVIDSDGFRFNVGIVLANGEGSVFWGRRVGMDAWQFPQGGIKPEETPEAAMLRELREEVGLEPQHVEILACTRRWLRYRLPRRFIRRRSKPICIGQKQIWFLLRMVGEDGNVRLDAAEKPEFDRWRWVSYWYPVRGVVAFKRGVYKQALTEFAPVILPDRDPNPPVEAASCDF